MSQIDSGLGWKCDSEYFVNSADTYLSKHSFVFYKTNDGSAVAVEAHFIDTYGYDYYAPFLVSTVEENVYYTSNTDTGGSVIIDGVTWYYSTTNYADLQIDGASAIPMMDFTALANRADWVVEILTAAHVVPSSSGDVPSVNYVQKYVEGVLKGLPTITNEQIDDLFN